MSCPVCGGERTRRSNYRRGVTCGAPPCLAARKAHGGRQGRGRPKPGLRQTNALKRYWTSGRIPLRSQPVRPILRDGHFEENAA